MQPPTFFVDPTESQTPKAGDFILKPDSWDDFGYRLQYRLSRVGAGDIGDVKILHKTAPHLGPPREFTKLDENYCSLGQHERFYERLSDLGLDGQGVLRALRDVGHDNSYARSFEDTDAFKKSLTRFACAYRIYRQGPHRQEAVKPPRFTYACRLLGFSLPHELSVDFTGPDGLPNRIMALIGNNNGGKSGCLAKLAYALSGEELGGVSFTPERPLVTSVIAVSYSLFQPFKTRIADGVSYKYCGFDKARTGDQRADFDARTILALGEIQRRGRLVELQNRVLELSRHADVDLDLAPTSGFLSQLGTVSTGVRLAAQIIFDLIAYAEAGAFLLVDEPELHLHPALTSFLVRTIDELLVAFDCYALIATHSASVIREIPARYVRIVERTGTVPSVRIPRSETFGATLTELEDSAFAVSATARNYQTRVRELVSVHGVEAVRKMFTSPLSINLEVALAENDNAET